MMEEKAIQAPLPADLPEDWTLDQIISPNGTESGEDERHGYNYQAKQINAAQRGVNALVVAVVAAQETAGTAMTAANAAGILAHTAKETADDALLTADNAAAEASVARADAKKAQTAADAALEAITKLAHTIDAVPSQNGVLAFTGGAQAPVWNSYNPETLTIGGVKTGTNAGTYTATFTPVEGYIWGDGTAATKPVTWSIGRATISTVPSQSGALTYTGSALTPVWNNCDTAKLTVGGASSAIDAGTYAATFTPTSNYQWANGTTVAKSVAWTIGQASVSAIPSQSGGLIYTGSPQSPGWNNYNSVQLAIEGTNSAIDAGTYTATFTPTSNYQWADSTTSAKSVNWGIGKAAGSLTINKTSIVVNKATPSTTIAATRAGNGAISATSSNPGVAFVSVNGTTITITGLAYGAVTITVSVAAEMNYMAPVNKTCSVQVNIFSATLNSNTWAAIGAASTTGEGANTWAVGDVKTTTINGAVGKFIFSNLSIDTFIIGFNHNSAREGSNRIHWQFGKVSGKMVALCDNEYGNMQTSAGYFHMNASHFNIGGWSSSVMRTALLGNNGTPTNPPPSSLLAALASDLRAVMKGTTKYTDNVGNNTGHVASNVTATTDYLFLLAEFEVFGLNAYANAYEKSNQAQYDYYKAGNSRISYKHSAISSTAWRWLRSPIYSNNCAFCCVWGGGDYSTSDPSSSAGVSPGFST